MAVVIAGFLSSSNVFSRNAIAQVHCVVAVRGADIGSVRAIHGLPGGGALIGAERGLFRVDPASGAVATAGGADMGPVWSIHGLPGGGALIRVAHGLFRVDPASGAVAPAGGADTGRVWSIHGLEGGGALIRAQRGWFRFDPASGAVAAAPGGADMQRSFSLHGLDGGGALIHAAQGVFLAPAAAIRNATIHPKIDLSRLAPSPNPVEVRLGFGHPCASVSDRLELVLAAATDGSERGPVPVRHPHDEPPSATSATLAASVVFDRPGAWTLALRQGATTIGQPLRFTIAGPTWWQWITRA